MLLRLASLLWRFWRRRRLLSAAASAGLRIERRPDVSSWKRTLCGSPLATPQLRRQCSWKASTFQETICLPVSQGCDYNASSCKRFAAAAGRGYVSLRLAEIKHTCCLRQPCSEGTKVTCRNPKLGQPGTKWTNHEGGANISGETPLMKYPCPKWCARVGSVYQ